ncbi:nicotinamide phosphoribosyltransferase domain-containing protein [Agrobacterium vitis]|uniref:nicotinamide phosphoribosyltransferase domain-containing protein n=1 Tax=Agrobacterium vitis TaxID=373 RepID=UPI003D2B0764
MSRINPILNTDSYKLGHFLQYPPGTRAVSGYVTTRGASLRPEVVFFGLQMFLKEYLSQPITQADIDEAQELAALHGQPFDQAGWHYILSAHGGFLPLRIEALPEAASCIAACRWCRWLIPIRPASGCPPILRRRCCGRCGIRPRSPVRFAM